VVRSVADLSTFVPVGRCRGPDLPARTSPLVDAGTRWLNPANAVDRPGGELLVVRESARRRLGH